MMSFAVATHTDLGLEPENAGRMDVFHELLSTLAGVLDIRDVFQRLSAVAARVIPHDEADLALIAEGGAHFRLYASTRAGEPELVCPGEHCALRDPSVPRVFVDGLGSDRGFQCGLRVPVQVNGTLIGVLALLSRQREAYAERELTLARRRDYYLTIAVSHQRLAEVARRAAVERDRSANLESSVELIRAIAGVLDIRTVFPRVSEIANKVLPHDRLTLTFNDRTGRIVFQAASTDDFPSFDQLRVDESAVRALE